MEYQNTTNARSCVKRNCQLLDFIIILKYIREDARNKKRALFRNGLLLKVRSFIVLSLAPHACKSQSTSFLYKHEQSFCEESIVVGGYKGPLYAGMLALNVWSTNSRKKLFFPKVIYLHLWLSSYLDENCQTGGFHLVYHKEMRESQ